MRHPLVRSAAPLLLLLLLFLSAPLQAAPAPPTAECRLVHFNDFHASYLPTRLTEEEGMPSVGGAAYVGAHLARLRRERPGTLVVFAGDMVQGSPLERATTGESLLRVMNRLAPDVAVIGNHEFDYGKARMRELLALATFPVTCANLVDAEGGPPFAKPWHIATTETGLRVLFLGLYPMSGKKYVEADHRVTVGDAYETVARLARERDADADLTVVVSHLGFDDDARLAERLGRTSEVDLIIGAHSHTPIDAIDPAHPIPIVQAFCNGLYLGVADLVVDVPGKRIASLAYRLQPTYHEGIDPDPEIDAIVKAEVAKMPDLFIPIASLSAPLGQSSRHGETALGNFSVDAFVDRFGTDLAFMNSKSIRNAIPGPTVCPNDLHEAFPFEGGLYKVRLTGANVVKMIEFYLNEKKDRTLYVPHTFSYRYRVGADGRAKVTAALLRGEPLKEDGSYTATVDDRTAGECERFYEAENLGKCAESIALTLADYSTETKIYTPLPGGRAVREAGAPGAGGAK